MQSPAQSLTIINPKRKRTRPQGRQDWYSFYASFSLPFAREIIASAQLRPAALVVDPWNGTGTSTLAVALNGRRGIGFDLNPAMVVVGQAKLVDHGDLAAIETILRSSSKWRRRIAALEKDDPLLVWFSDDAVSEIRAVEKCFCDLSSYSRNEGRNGHKAWFMHAQVAFFYLSLFRVVRTMIAPFLSSNPTWVRDAKRDKQRIRVRQGTVGTMFRTICQRMASSASIEQVDGRARRARVDLAAAESLPLGDGSVDFVLASPPYCTRIDYAIATKPELAVLGFGGERLRNLRHALTGTLTVNGSVRSPSKEWGPTCLRFLDILRNHPSKASETYYLRTHLQYFSSIAQSVSEIGRVMRAGGRCVLVVQDSYYKNIRNDLASIFGEIAQLSGLNLDRRQDFELSRTMARINPRTKKYRCQHTAVESVLCFSKS